MSTLNYYCVGGTANKWIFSYLENQQYVTIYNYCQSHTRIIKYGIPQSLILGPLLFILNINDIKDISELANLILFIDDSNMFISGSELNSWIVIANN